MSDNKQPLFIDRKDNLLINLIALAPMYKKQVAVSARLVDSPEVVHTVLADGNKETENFAVFGDWVVTNPTGEQYVIKSSVFFNRYEPTEVPGVYLAKGYCRAVVNPYGEKIKITPSWGGEQVGDWQCFIADSCDYCGICDGEPYIIDSQSFNATYAPVK